MAQLYYENLGVHRPDVLLRRTFSGLKVFHDFLSRTKRYLEEVAVLRLAWEPGVAPDPRGRSKRVDGVWVRLKEPEDHPNEPESTFRAFFEEEAQIFEGDVQDDETEAGSRRRRRLNAFRGERRIVVLDADLETNQLLLDRLPESGELLLRPHTLTLFRQLQAVSALQSSPSPFHRPLLRLFEALDHAQWPSVHPDPVESWLVITDEARDGADEQRRFVEIALGTSDFAFLEGPPGSGKTTAICELVLQLVRRGKRVLLCASTHVAVDNMLERLMSERNLHRDMVIPVRVGDRRNISEAAGPWQLERFVATERRRLQDSLQKCRELTASQRLLRDAVQGSTAIERMVLDAANLVCGTTIGILQHPDIKANRASEPLFDVLIVDEASKTTFQEFLVPALLAKRWIIVGDPKQLSPYVEDDALAVNLGACLDDEAVRNACIDVFLAGQKGEKQRVTVAVTDRRTEAIYRAQAKARDVDMASVGAADGLQLAAAPLVIGDLEGLERREAELPLDATTLRASENVLDGVRRRAAAWARRAGVESEPPEWAAEISWRLGSHYEQRLEAETEGEAGIHRSARERLWHQIQGLLPAPETGIDAEALWSEIDRVRRVALPSVLESLQKGFERGPRDRGGSALTDGLPEFARRQRHVLLRAQHRMHPEIAQFSHEHMYGGEALRTPARMAADREWSYPRYAHRAMWLHTSGRFERRWNRNRDEVHIVLEELRHFDSWALQHAHTDGRPWQVAVLTFYRGQEREVRGHLQRWSRQQYSMRHFVRGDRERPYLTVELCTVDRFQGHEADLVILTLANDRASYFLQSPNRLNVALTRARFQRIVVGNRHAMARAKPGLLGVLAEQEPWGNRIGGTSS